MEDIVIRSDIRIKSKTRLSSVGNRRITIQFFLVRYLVVLIVFMSSFDIFATIEFSFGTIRYSQLLEMILILFAAIDSITVRSPKAHGFIYLILFFLINTVFIPNSLSLTNAIGYDAWLFIDIFTLYSIVHFVERAYTAKDLARWFIVSIVVMAVLGLIQRCLQVFNIFLWVTQPGRINGFTFEPSYYATYMLSGWTTVAYLFEKKDSSIFTTGKITFFLIVISVVLIISTSKIAWMTMLAWVLFRLAVNFFILVFTGKKVKESQIFSIFAFPLIVLAFFSLITYLDPILNLTKTYFAGSGLLGTSAHSSMTRFNHTLDGLNRFILSPIIGTSLGGTDPAMALYRGVQYVGNGGGTNVLFEIGIGTGIFGLFMLLAFLWRNLIYDSFVRTSTEGTSILIKAFAWGAIVQLIVLNANQNILRIYFWITLSVVCSLVVVFVPRTKTT